MLIDDLATLADELGADVFDEYGTHYVQVLGSTATPNDYGGTDTTETTGDEIPGFLFYPQSIGSRSVLSAAGQEYSDATVLLPVMYGGEAVAVDTDDRLGIVEQGDNSPARTFQVKRIKPHSDVYLEIDVVTA